MLATRLAWPKVLGITCGMTSLGLVLSQVDPYWWLYSLSDDPVLILRWAFLLAAISLLALSYPLFRGREWARRPVLILGGFLIFAGVVSQLAREIAHWIEMWPQTSIGGWALFEITAHFFSHAGSLVGVFTPPVMFLCLLCHRDVKAAFHRNATKRSNQLDGADSEQPRA